MIDTEDMIKEISEKLLQRKLGRKTVIEVQGYTEGSREREIEQAKQEAFDIAAEIVEEAYQKAKKKQRVFGYVHYDGRDFYTDLPFLKTEHKDGEVTFSGFKEVKG